MRRLLIGLVLVVAACGGESAGDADADTPLSTTSTAPPTTTTSSSTTTTTIAFIETAASISLVGDQLPRFGAVPDPAVGRVAPTAAGTDFRGNPVEIEPSGSYTVLMFLAHWCPHCQDEVDQLGPYFEATPPPSNIDVVAVSTGVDENRPNYPPSEWLTPEAWSAPVLVDTADGAVGAAFGLNAYPFWVVLDPDGVVLGRTAGSLPLESVEALFDNLAALEG